MSTPDNIPADVREKIRAANEPLKNAIGSDDAQYCGEVVEAANVRICAALAPFFAAKDAELADLKAQLAEANAILDWVDRQDCWIGLHGEYDLSARFYVGGSYEMKVRSAYESAMQQEGQQ